MTNFLDDSQAKILRDSVASAIKDNKFDMSVWYKDKHRCYEVVSDLLAESRGYSSLYDRGISMCIAGSIVAQHLNPNTNALDLWQESRITIPEAALSILDLPPEKTDEVHDLFCYYVDVINSENAISCIEAFIQDGILGLEEYLNNS